MKEKEESIEVKQEVNYIPQDLRTSDVTEKGTKAEKQKPELKKVNLVYEDDDTKNRKE